MLVRAFLDRRAALAMTEVGAVITKGELRALVADTVLVWGSEARLRWEGGMLNVTVADGRTAAVTAGGPGRWMLHAEGRARPHASITGLLLGLRAVLGPDDAQPSLRVVPPRD